ncbi:MAG: Rieske (2Fe-2S) protein, partial [Burkholderiales bacterium]|nr:Rieske (2Fe-2S) protein [Burkholderiales bacterium]
MNPFNEILQQAPLDNAHALHAVAYTDPNFLVAEYQSIFEQQWQLAGHISQLTESGDQLVTQVGRIPIVVVKNQDNKIKAFHNVCRHRAGPLATENNNSKVLRCKYHGWTYSLDGVLKSAPEMQSTPNFKLCQHHLPEAAVSMWQGFIFVALKTPKNSLDELLDNIVDQIKPIDLTALEYSHRDEYLIDCNWKVYMD